MRTACPACGCPVRVFTVEQAPVVVDDLPRFGPLTRTHAFLDTAQDTGPHPGGWAPHPHQEAAAVMPA